MTAYVWNSRRFLTDLEHLDRFQRLFVKEMKVILRGGNKYVLKNPANDLALVEVHLQYLDEARSIKSRARMVAETGPLLMTRALYDSLVSHFRMPPFVTDTLAEVPDPVAARLLGRNPRALVILNFIRIMMSSVAFYYYNMDDVDDDAAENVAELEAAIDAFDNYPDESFRYLERRILRRIILGRPN